LGTSPLEGDIISLAVFNVKIHRSEMKDSPMTLLMLPEKCVSDAEVLKFDYERLSYK
jgi:hypothetical protein